jgi:hypothetical protein
MKDIHDVTDLWMKRFKKFFEERKKSLASTQVRLCLVCEKKIFGCYIGCVGRMSGGVFGY